MVYNRKKHIKFSDIVVSILAMLLLVFLVCLISNTSKYLSQGLFQAISIGWQETCDTIEAMFGIDKCIADVEIPIVNCNVTWTSYTR